MLRAGIKIAINTAMIAITTNSSINVKALVFIAFFLSASAELEKSLLREGSL